MPLTGDEIRRRLGEFAARWRGYEGTEKAEAQSFLNELLACYGADRFEVARFEEPAGAGVLDMIWPGVCIVEMKRPREAERLAAHREQAFDYWKEVSRRTGRAGAHVVLCAFRRFEVFEPGVHWDLPVAAFDLDALPEQYEALGFLGGLETRYVEDRAELTREAVSLVTQVFQRLEERGGADPEVRTDLILQSVWCLFAEDLGIVPGRGFSRILEELIDNPRRSSADDLAQLFRYLAEPGPRPEHGLYAGVPYADGGLFARPAIVHLELDELELLRQAAGYNWKLVEPAIFGSLLEGALGPERVWALGAHYTAEADIMKVVGPTVIEPWRERIDACETLEEVERARRDLAAYVVLDPACGSGNFLYVAYRSLRRLEQELHRLERRFRHEAGLGDASVGPAFPISNMRGIETEPFAVQLARVTLWMGHKLAVDELAFDEPVLPLADLSGIWLADALKVEWPRADAIIGNPPYHGSQMIRRELGDDYAEWLKEAFGIGLKDYAVYWFRKAHERLEPGGRAGLVATNSISQNRSRGPSLDWIVSTGGVITEAISSRPWSGAAHVHVSIVNWVKLPSKKPTVVRLDGNAVAAISAALRPESERLAPARLNGNSGVSFQGVIPAGMGFVIGQEEAEKLLSDDHADYAAVVRRYLMGEDIAADPAQEPTRWIIDFANRPLEEARAWPRALKLVEEKVRPSRERNRDRGFRERWWQFGRARGEMRAAVSGLSRILVANRVGKRLFFAWAEPTWCPGDKVVVFRLDDDFSFGVLACSLHSAWAWALSSTLKADLNYTPTSAFETFPWPDPTAEQREAIAELARRLVARRREICAERQIGLTRLYNEVDDGAYRDLRELHSKLDEAVAAAYGWPRSAAHDPAESNRRLLELNRRIAAGEVDYRPFG